MKSFFSHTKSYMFRGFLAVVPLALSFYAVKFLYVTIDLRVMNLIYKYVGFKIPGLGILFVLIILYLLGLIASNVIGRKILNVLEKITQKIPLVKTTYQIGKQLAGTLSLPDKQIFSRVVLVEYLTPGIWTIGFVTGDIEDKTKNETLLKVYIPTPPNPASGTLVIVRESQVRDPGWTIEEALKAVMSGGIIGPSVLGS